MRRKLLLFLVLCSPMLFANDIPVLGLDENGDEVVEYVTKENYAEGVHQMIDAVQTDVMPTLIKASEGKEWKVRTASLGIGLDMSVGFPPFFTLGIAPRFNAVFSNSKTPINP